MGTRILYFIRHAVLSVRTTSLRFWKWFSSRPRWQQAGMALIALAVLIGGGVAIAQSGGTAASADQMPTVTTATVGALSGTDSSVSVLGTVRSVSEADILAQAGGTVEAVHTKLGASVPAGFVVAELDNAIERAQVLQAEGAYESALAARTSVSPADATLNARNTYRTSFSTMDTTLHTQIDVFFGNETPVGPQLLLNQGSMSIDQISRNRVIIGTMLEQRRSGLSSVATRDPEQLLNESESDLNAILLKRQTSVDQT
jgi:multidrug efflux pump subunit AcrA (membrane-fusion protein)